MSLATLDQLFDEVPLSHEHLERFGYREEELSGERFYVGRNDKGFAITVKRHRAKGLFNKGFRKKKKTVLPEQESTMKMYIDKEALAKASEATNRAVGQAAESLKTVDFSKLGTPTPPTPQEKPGMFRRTALWVTDKFYDEAWHKGARNTAGTVLMWGFTVFALVTFGKGLLWLTTL
jgi:hypothetical protein